MIGGYSMMFGDKIQASVSGAIIPTVAHIVVRRTFASHFLASEMFSTGDMPTRN